MAGAKHWAGPHLRSFTAYERSHRYSVIWNRLEGSGREIKSGSLKERQKEKGKR
jgi:hypothetical protein